MNLTQLMKKDETSLFQLASEYFESSIVDNLKLQDLTILKRGQTFGPDFDDPFELFYHHFVPFWNPTYESELFISNLDNLRKAEAICNLPVLKPINVTHMLGRIAATYMVVDFEKYQADVERICFNSPNLLPETQMVLLYYLITCYIQIGNYHGAYRTLEILDDPKYRDFHLDSENRERKRLKNYLLNELNKSLFKYNTAAYYKTLKQAYNHYYQQQRKKLQPLQKARLMQTSSRLALQRGQGQGGQHRAHFTLTDQDMKFLGPGGTIIRDRVQTGTQLPKIQYASKPPTQTPQQQKVRQTVKHVTSEMKDDPYKLLMEMLQPTDPR